ncbi:Mn-dependent transcriptional regulator MntR [Christiangramia flava JLT2011]|uniref:Transcriptional regulator MntR n=2 Tax=Christiangramia TaxID=292691 RepID=A0A1L7I328_9FLAO|nr:Mn-dependent transcriptional regulator MntR [Christiangramia flava JLT2011]OSS40510.1 Mn-dependent transcriptional regulator MntR [Christiangramia flava JLT2011]
MIVSIKKCIFGYRKYTWMISLSEENYLKAIFHLETTFKKGVSTNALAEEMETKASSVTDMVKRLSEKKLVNYKKYQGVKLSPKGRATAVEIIRKHRLWECFLVEKLNFNWDEVHEVAEQLEHVKSEKLTREIDRFLGFPKTDPHGDPIPDVEGNFIKTSRALLMECDEGETVVIVGVKDSSTAFLRFLDKNNLKLGSKMKLMHKEDFDDSVLVETETGELHLSKKIAANLFIRLTNES